MLIRLELYKCINIKFIYSVLQYTGQGHMFYIIYVPHIHADLQIWKNTHLSGTVFVFH